MADRNEFDFEGVATPSEAADTLTRIAEGIRAHSLALSLGEEQITVYPAGDLSLEIEAREKKGKAKIEIAIAWKQPKAAADDEEAKRGSGMSKDRFKFARIASPEETAEFLTSLAVGLKRGEVSLESGEQRLHLLPAGAIKLELKVAQKERKGQIAIELGWKRQSAPKTTELRVAIGARP